jgi:hypothetical protein
VRLRRRLRYFVIGVSHAAAPAIAASILLAACQNGNSATLPADEPLRVQVTPTWSIAIPRDFKRVDNGDSWQAFDQHRSVYLSSLSIGDSDGHSTTPTDISELGARVLGKDIADGIVERGAGRLRGQAAVHSTSAGLELKGFVATEGRVAVCVIHADDVRFKAWAIDVWKSIDGPDAR